MDLPVQGFAHDSRPLRFLFLDLNSYFASVEQQEHPALRGRPVAVVPVDADTSFVIAASYEAKAFGVKTGTRVGDAKRMCPGLVVMTSTPGCYLHYHQRVLEVAESVLPVDKVCSIDEMRFRLLGRERDPEVARDLALRMKRAILEGVGECMKCSVGIAPNPWLAKVGTELEKPDGLVILTSEMLPHHLVRLKLTDLPGINRKMQGRLQAAGIFSVEDLVNRDAKALREAFGSIVGEHWWYLLRGYELGDQETKKRSLGHSHVLPPELRTDEGAKQVLLRLTQKAAARLRSQNLCAKHLELRVKGLDRSWALGARIPPTMDSIHLVKSVLELWEKRDFAKPFTVYVTFTELTPPESVTPSLFAEDSEVQELEMSRAMDALNQKFGKHTVFLAGMEGAKHTASEKIAFNKTWLFKEGKDDHDWVNTRTAETE